MALLQIKEPNQKNNAQKSTARKLAVGIDLGTTFSALANLNNQNQVHFFHFADKPIVPSIVGYSKNNKYFGYEAIEKAKQKDISLIHSVKRLIGTKFDNIKNLDFFSYPISANKENNLIDIHTPQGAKNPIEISADILSFLKSKVFQSLGQIENQTLNAVITVPAYFDDTQRQATKDAAKIAGINPLRIINEPTSAALAYGLDKKEKGIFAVYDLGGGTFDFSILKMQNDIFQVLASSGDTALGGNDFDQILMKQILNDLNLSAHKTTQKDLFTLWQLTKDIKHQLSKEKAINQSINLATKKIDFCLNRKQFNQMIKTLIDKTIDICHLAIKDAKIKASQIDGIILVGGSSRIPLVAQVLKKSFNCKIYNSHNPDTVVAQGAALQADILIGNSNNNPLLLDITPLSLGIEVMGGLVEKIIPRNSPIPISQSQQFTTFKNNQTAVSIHILQGEREAVKDCRSLAKFSIAIDPMPAGFAQLEVDFQLDADGILVVSAFEHKSNKKAQIMVKPSYGLDQKVVEKMIHNSYQYAQEDLKFRQQKSNIIKAERLIEQVDNVLKTDKNLLSKAEISKINQTIKDLKKSIEQLNGNEIIIQQTEKLKGLADNFADKCLKNKLKAL